MILGLVAFCNFAAAQQPASERVPTIGSITGRVVNESGQPLVGAVITATSAGNTGSRRITFSNAEGDFKIGGLEQNLYYISANLPAYVTPPLDLNTPRPFYRLGDSIRLELIRGGVITGIVTNANNEPLTGVNVRAFIVRDVTGRSTKGTVLAFGSAVTDDRGVYRMYGLPQGTYLVQAGGGDNDQNYNATSFDAPTFAPSSTRDTASEIQVRSGEEALVDIRYRGEPGHSVSGTVRSGNRSGARITLSYLGEGSVPISNTFQQPNSRGFLIAGIADGEYEIAAQEILATPNINNDTIPEMSISDSIHVSVKGSDVTGIELVPKPLASISGRIALEPSKLPECLNKRVPSFNEMMVTLLPNKKENPTDQFSLIRAFLGSVTVDKDGAFNLRNITSGQYSFKPSFFARYWYLKTMVFAAGPAINPTKSAVPVKDAARNWTTLKSGERLTGLTITLSEGAGSIKGQIEKGETETLEPGLHVYVVPVDREKVDDPLRYFQSDITSEGTFTITNLPPGRYKMMAQAEPTDIPTTTTLRLPDAIAARTKIHLAAESKKTEVELKPCQNLTDYKLPLH